jgi:hypothetical protein
MFFTNFVGSERIVEVAYVSWPLPWPWRNFYEDISFKKPNLYKRKRITANGGLSVVLLNECKLWLDEAFKRRSCKCKETEYLSCEFHCHGFAEGYYILSLCCVAYLELATYSAISRLCVFASLLVEILHFNFFKVHVVLLTSWYNVGLFHVLYVIRNFDLAAILDFKQIFDSVNTPYHCV